MVVEIVKEPLKIQMRNISAPNLNNIWKNIENMNNQINKELKDYTDQELANELAKRINDFSLDPIYLLYPLVVAGTQYLNWYNAEKVSKKEKQATK